MKEKRTLLFAGKAWQMPLRVLTLITLFIGAYALAQSVLELTEAFETQNVSILVVVIYLLVTPLCFLGALFFAYTIHRMSTGRASDNQFVLGYAMLVLAAVDNLIYISIHYKNGAISFYILGGILLICYIICFLHYQDLGTRVLTLCAAILLVACTLLQLEEAIRYFLDPNIPYDFIGYYFSQTVLNTLLAIETLLFVLGLQRGVTEKGS
ncbi:MAG: hypothetical protein J1F22_07410 [Lachnospiraceae bacterium]|nr:hypothetical protein [Lachnospiraceae bacterium]